MNCANHQDREAKGSCVYCGKMFCTECLVEVKGRMYCKADVANSVSATPNITINNTATATAVAYAGGRQKRMHWFYFLFIGWWLGITLACFIIPLFIPGLVPAAFGYW